jgi:sigma-B regulation protein RsbU (phosphoserine phosphatase)
MRILIAEDDFTSRIMLAAILKKDGHEVIEVDNGADAWETLQKPDAPRLAILDWIMPNMDGIEVVSRIRAHHLEQQPYIIMLTARGDKSDIIAGLEAGADDYIAKPYDKQELHARINVGSRMINLQNELRNRDKLQGVLEMAGAVCHELNQPLQIVSGFSELLMMDLNESDPKYHAVREIKSGIDRIGKLTRKIMHISTYKTKEYLGGKTTIIDIVESANPDL